MIWLSWRQARTSFLTAVLAVAAVVTLTLATGPHLRDLAAQGGSLFDALTGNDRNLFYAGIALVAAAPPIIGAFWGAPLVARELEAGTYRLVWTQSVTRSRWLGVKTALTCAVAAAVIALVSLAVTWWSSPLDGAVGSTHGGLPGRLTPISFAMRGIAPIGYVLFALALGIAVGAVLRRSLLALAVTLALYVVVQLLVPAVVRPHLLPPVVEAVTIGYSTLDGINSDAGPGLGITLHTGDRDDWIIAQTTIDSDGRPATLPLWFVECITPRNAQPATQSSGATSLHTQAGTSGTCLARLSDAGYRQLVTYQPADRFWPLQGVETALYVTAAALLLAVSWFWVSRRIG